MKNYLKKSVLIIFGTMLMILLNIQTLNAENITQTFSLKPGWNAVFLDAEPQATAPEVIFSGVTDLQSVWMWNSRASAVESVQNPDSLEPGNPQWLTYLPGDTTQTNLFAIHGETPYLIHLGGTAGVTWTVTGEPRVPSIDWKANSFNFVGFHLNEGHEPTFLDFFSASRSHANQESYTLDNTTATWVKVTDLNTRMKHGEAFWIYCKGSSEFVGPLSVQLEQGNGLHYGSILVEQDLRVLNNAAEEKTVSLKVSSESVKLHYWLFDPENNMAEWVEFPADPPLDLKIAAGERQKLRLGVRRAGLTAGTTYKANVELKDDKGMHILLPVSVTGIDFTGLWVGNATITKVSEVQKNGTPVPVGSEFSLRLIVHVDSNGKARLLREIIQMWQEGTWKPDPNDLGKLIPDDPGQFVLIANNSLISQYSGAALRDGQPVGRRISSAAFGFTGPQDMAPEDGFQLDKDLSVSLVLLPNDPTNPFRHKYHPEHAYNPDKPPPPERTFQITRTITLKFRDKDDEGKPLTGVPILSWGSTDVGGIYKEVISGLHREDIHIEGTFLLHKVSSVEQIEY